MAGCITTYTVTPTVPTTFSCYITGCSGVSAIGEANEMPYAEIEEISRQPVIVNTVDYISAYQSLGSQGINTGDETLLKINLKTSGNMTLNSDYTVTLKSGRTYLLEGGLGYSDTSAIDIYFYNITTSKKIQENGVTMGTAQNASTSVHFTPSIDTKVGLMCKCYASGSLAYATRILGGWMTITQVGSTGVSSIGGQYIDTPWIPYTPIIGGTTSAPTLPTTNTIRASYSVIGKTLKINFFYTQTGTTNNGGSGCYLISLPNNLTINTTLTGTESSPSLSGNLNPVLASQVGRGKIHGLSTAQYTGNVTVLPYSATQLLVFTDHSGGAYFSSALFAINGGWTNLTVTFQAEIPLL
jgi:hypothetical protein